MYHLFIRDGSEDGVGYFRLAGIFPPSNFWTQTVKRAEDEFGKKNVTYRFHMLDFS